MSKRPVPPADIVPNLVSRRSAVLMLSSSALLAACGDGGGGGGTPTPTPTPAPTPTPTPTPTPAPVVGAAWFSYGHDAQHTAVSANTSQDLGRIAWSTPVDMQPQYTSYGALLTHYGSPVSTTRNTIVVPVKTGANGGYRIEGRNGATNTLIWSMTNNYAPPPHNWLPPYNVLLTAQGKLYVPDVGGRLAVRADPDAATSAMQSLTFYGDATYTANAAAFDANVFVCTPLTADANGNVFFGFQVNTGTSPGGLVSGIARIGADGVGSWVSATTAAGDAAIIKPAMNCAPAISADGATVYIAVNTAGATPRGYLLALNATTLATRAKVALNDPSTGTAARISDDGTAAPVIGSDGRVFYGVLEPTFGTHNGRGWLLQFDASLNPVGVPGSFGWDVSPSIIPASMVPTYAGTSTYLLAVKYNNYAGAGTGDGMNKLAILDPKASQADFITPSVQVMKEILTILGPTPDGTSGTGRREWCINTMAADPARKSILANNEDGIVYRWDLTNNTLSQSIKITAGLGQAYTPTLIGADGAVYAISNAILFSIRA
ncbi:hypothetical protein FPZ24_12275 [Sphingomonas panacisoli]|uniref:Pyrrolo-quinoline quinone n=1 Tax=Sphingomonas panacisoli TaxID=1813879 RepID=A0A5B8LJT9_9SPHN|nr:hypothetical protein [Sphingomonas panacisoli]QDZ08159.1 hypothetical protein FPZ24_12275 [Sphingomonas panacisoli]